MYSLSSLSTGVSFSSLSTSTFLLAFMNTIKLTKTTVKGIDIPSTRGKLLSATYTGSVGVGGEVSLVLFVELPPSVLLVSPRS